jgi:FkbM family methyltransferase
MQSARLARSFTRLDRWREVPRCFQEFEQPLSLVNTYLGISRLAMPTTLKHRSGMRLQITEFGDVEAIWQIFLRRVYEVRPSDRVIVDAGGNVGLFTCYASWRAPESRILTIEPFPSTVERLKAQLAENRLDSRVSVLDRALSAVPSDVTMLLDTPSSQQKPVVSGSSAGRTVHVQSIPLSDALVGLPEHIDLLKMDIEGSEFEVLMNTPLATLRRFRRINLEHHEPPPGSSHSKVALVGRLAEAGFRVRQHAGAADRDYGILHCEQ